MKVYWIGVAALAFCLPTQADCEEARFAHVRTWFTLTVHAGLRDTAALFGPNGERGWGGGKWDPKFFYPQPGDDVAGAVFAIKHGDTKSIWVNTLFDLDVGHDVGHFQYVYFVPDALVTTIDVHFVPADARNTNVTVVYTRTALDPDANEHVRSLGESDSRSGKDWEKAINDYLGKQKH